jgi:hypothetical protein
MVATGWGAGVCMVAMLVARRRPPDGDTLPEPLFL